MLHQLVRLHPDLAWITPLTNWVCGHDWQNVLGERFVRWAGRFLSVCPPSVRPPFLRGPFDGSFSNPGLPETAEGHSIWNRHLPTARHEATEEDVTPEARRYLHRVVDWHTRYARASRFVCKTPRNLLRIRYFREVFPDAHFVHLIRDGRAIAASILKRRQKHAGDPNVWWGVRPPGWQEQQSRPPIEQCAWVWQTCLEYADQMARTHVPASQFHTLKYESLTQTPKSILQNLFASLDCAPETYHLPSSVRDQIHPPHSAWRTRLTETQIDALTMLDDTLKEKGYPPVHAST